MHFQDLGLLDRFMIFSDGQELVQYFDTLLGDYEKSNCEPQLQPVSLLLLDINMPILDGIETQKLIMEKFQKLHERSPRFEAQEEKPINTRAAVSRNATLLRPFICYVTQYECSTMQQFMQIDERPEAYLEKPAQLKDLTAILRLVNII